MKNILNVLPPEINSEWKILEVIRSSSSSQIYKVYNTNSNCGDNNIKIIKVINENIFDNKTYDIVKKIDDIHIQNITDIIYSQNNYYIITEYLPTLTYIICNNGLTGNDIFNIAIDISIALNILHKHKILHLDCTPDNIYRNADGSYCLGDFSSAIILNNKSNHQISGTNGFVPPEILDGNTPTFLSDEYVYASLIYTLFNDGYSPDIPYIDNITQNISPKFYSIIVKGCSKNPSDRYDSINAMYNDIDEIICSDNQKEKDYLLSINDEMHPLYYLKTSDIKFQSNSHIKNVKQNIKNNNKNSKKKVKSKQKDNNISSFQRKKDKKNLNNDADKNIQPKHRSIKSIIFIAIAVTIFVFSYYNYVYKPKHENELSDEEIESLIELNEIIKDSDILNSDDKSNDTNTYDDETTKKDYTINTVEYDLGNIELTSLPDEQNNYFECNEIKCLYADNNKISSLDNIEYYTSLNELYISDNNIVDLTPIEELEDLEILVISYNNVKDLMPICYLTSLTNLDLSGNENLTNISELISLHHLKTLNVTNTNITKEEIEFLSINLPNCIILY